MYNRSVTQNKRKNKMTKVTCNHCQKTLEMIDANWIFIDETKPGTADNMEWCCDKCLEKIEENN
jgi:hypothetical protein